jgi:hypothetical protein
MKRTLTGDELIRAISEVLVEADADDLAGIANLVLTGRTKHLGRNEDLEDLYERETNNEDED